MAAPTFIVRVAILKEAIDRVKHAALTTDTRPILSSVLIRAHERGVQFVAADNYRIAFLVVEGEVKGGEWPQVVVDLADVAALRAFLRGPRNGALVKLESRDDRLVVKDKARVLVLGTVHGTYPDVDGVFPAARRPILSINPAYLAGLLKGATKYAPFITLEYAGKLDPVVFRLDDDYTEVIMPVRTAYDRRLPRDDSWRLADLAALNARVA